MLEPGATADEPRLAVAVVLRVHDRDRFDLKATALGEASRRLEGVRLEVTSPGLAEPAVLVSDGYGDIRAAGGELPCGLPLTCCELVVRLAGGEEYGADLRDLLGPCWRSLAEGGGPSPDR